MDKRIDKLLEDVRKCQDPKWVVEMYISGHKEIEQVEANVFEGLMGLYTDLNTEDADIFDPVLARYEDDDQYSLQMAVIDLLSSNLSQYANNRVGKLVQEHKFSLLS